MSEILNKQQSEIEKEFEDTESESEPANKKHKMNKTHITELTELTARTKSTPPVFTELDKDNFPAELVEADIFKFFIKVNAMNKDGYGTGATKKQAKHNAAANLLLKLNNSAQDDDDDNDEMFMQSSIASSDYITELLNFCVQRNYHKPTITEIESFGSSHCPTFIFECQLDSITMRASASTKQQARQLAAEKILNILKRSYPDIEKKVAIVNDNNQFKEEIRKKITTYMEMKKLEKTDTLGVSIADRHNFFINYSSRREEFVQKLKEILTEDDINDDEKYQKLLDELQTEWEYSISKFPDTNLKKFELLIDFDQFSVVILQAEDKLRDEILKYFATMLEINQQNFDNGGNYNTSFDSSNIDLTLVPIR